MTPLFNTVDFIAGNCVEHVIYSKTRGFFFQPERTGAAPVPLFMTISK
jgi:hypothetical protein